MKIGTHENDGAENSAETDEPEMETEAPSAEESVQIGAETDGETESGHETEEESEEDVLDVETAKDVLRGKAQKRRERKESGSDGAGSGGILSVIVLAGFALLAYVFFQEEDGDAPEIPGV